MIAEYYTMTVTVNRSSRNTTWQHGPIVAANINPSGEIDWVKAVPKMQVYTKVEPAIGLGAGGGGVWFGFNFWLNLSKDQTVYHSYLLAVKEDKLYFIYNDHPKNIEVKHMRDTKILGGYKGSVPVTMVVDGDGNISKEILMEKDRSEVVLRPGIKFQEDYGDIIIYGSRRNKDKFGWVRY